MNNCTSNARCPYVKMHINSFVSERFFRKKLNETLCFENESKYDTWVFMASSTKKFLFKILMEELVFLNLIHFQEKMSLLIFRQKGAGNESLHSTVDVHI